MAGLRAGKGKDRGSVSKGCGGGRPNGFPPAPTAAALSKPQNWDVILLRVVVRGVG